DWRMLRTVRQDVRGVIVVHQIPQHRIAVESRRVSGSANAMLPDVRLTDLVRQINSFRELHEGWDGDRAPPPSVTSIQRAIEIALLSPRLPDEVDPDAIGGVALWFYVDDGRSMMISIRNDGRAAVCAYHSNSPVPDVKIVTDASSAARLVGESLA